MQNSTPLLEVRRLSVDFRVDLPDRPVERSEHRDIRLNEYGCGFPVDTYVQCSFGFSFQCFRPFPAVVGASARSRLKDPGNGSSPGSFPAAVCWILPIVSPFLIEM